ncbi:hypothetical protein [Hwanghaeella sp.]|uniref:hypothetical protein n=1 Tax=Hwanghaeella sp. TaxID=2605943 RepID=UPI003CCB7E5A
MTARDFTRAGYRELLQALTERGYRPATFATCDPNLPDLVLRHDLDFAPDLALPLAEIEAELGMTAAYFILPETPFYTIRDPAARKAIKSLIALGHEVGLHFDAAAGEDTAEALDRAAFEQCAALEDIAGAPVGMISFHRPAKALLGRKEEIGGRPHTYQPRYFSEMGYCSDSRGLWRFGHPLEHEAVAERRALQLLTHPIWWANDDGGNREAALARLVDRLGDSIKPAIAETVTGYDPVTGRIAE